jgi:glycosyltransferase involved in cell wall biosynthesis
VTRILFATQVLDARHPFLGATAAKVRALAARVDEVVVLAAAGSLAGEPENVRLRSFAAPSQALRGARFEAALAAELLRGRPLAIVAHMSPVFALLAAPAARPLRIPLLLWFTQQGSGAALARAERVVDAILTVDERSVPLDSPKVLPVGHGIDVEALPCVGERTPPLRRLLGLGRYAPVKGWETALQALAGLPDARLALHGSTPTSRERVHLPGLERLAAELGVAERVSFGGEVPHAEVPSLLAAADALVNPTAGNAADKVVFEAAASCLPVFAASPVFDGLLPEALRFPAGDAEALAARIRDYGGGAGPDLRARVAAGHSAAHWAEQVLEAAGA